MSYVRTAKPGAAFESPSELHRRVIARCERVDLGGRQEILGGLVCPLADR